MNTGHITFALSDDSPGYAVSPARVPLLTLAAFANEVQAFLKGSDRDGSADSVEVAIVEGSLAIQASNLQSGSLMRDLRVLASGADLEQIDEKRRSIIRGWQSSAQQRESWQVKINAADGMEVVISNATRFREMRQPQLVNVERYVRGEVLNLGGVKEPTARIRLPDGTTLVVRADKSLIRAETANHLYKQVHARIRARLDIDTGKLVDAELVEFVDHAPSFDERAFDQLTEKGEQAWKDVDDPADWVRKLRGTSD
jgi:hypothetical protein